MINFMFTHIPDITYINNIIKNIPIECDCVYKVRNLRK